MGAELGISRLLGEIPQGSFGLVNEFDNHLGITATAEFSKYIASKIELGTELGITVLNGNTYVSDFSAEGNHFMIPDNFSDPVKYQNVLLNADVFVRYFFKPAFSQSSLNPFVEAGGGILSYYSTLSAIESGDVIFGKGTGENTKLSTPGIFVGAGFKTSLSAKKFLLTTVDFKFVNYDFLDVMHNYTDDGLKQKMTGMYAGFKIGFFFSTGTPGKSGRSSSVRKGGNITSNGGYLPFSK